LGMVDPFCDLGVDLVERALERVCNGTEEASLVRHAAAEVFR